MQYRTINLYRSTISMTHAPVDGCVIGSHPIISRFNKGIFQLRMPTPKYLVTWDVSVVLGYLKTSSPKNSLSLKQSTLKLAMLMALISFNPISTGLFCLVVALGGGGGVFHPPSITPLSLKLDCSNFVRRYFQIG